MKELLEKLNAAELEANRIDELWEADPDNAELEAQWDAAYKTEDAAFAKVVSELVKITSGQIDRSTAASMLRRKRAEVEKLFL